MKDFPFFTTQNGVASLVFKEIPYSGEAYVTLRDTKRPEALLQECLDFCIAVGAQRVLATGHRILEQYPVYTQVFEMSVSLDSINQTDVSLFPVTEKTLDYFRRFYNEKMRSVPCVSFMTVQDAKAILAHKSAYYVHNTGNFLGIVITDGNVLEAVATSHRGMGETLVQAAAHAMTGDVMRLEAAATNAPAMRLYERMGFVKTACKTTWYKII